jgi:hypothetical protein
MRMRSKLAGLAVLVLLPGRLLAQDPPDDSPPPEPDPPAEAPERAEPAPEASSGEITGEAKAGLVESMMGSSGSSHSESSSESSSSSVTFGNSASAPAPTPDRPSPGGADQMPGSPSGWTVGKVAGTWTLQLAGVSCGIQLRDSKWMGEVYSAYPSNTCADGVSQVGYWQPTGNGGGIRLLDKQSHKIAELWPYGPKRYEGKIAGEKAVLTR